MNNDKELKPMVVFNEGLNDDERVAKIAKVLECNENRNIAEEELLNGSKKKYLILYYMIGDDNDIIKGWDEIKGRESAFKFIKSMVDSIDIHASKIMVDTVPFSEAVSIYEFMQHVQGLIDDEFDIEDYNNGQNIID